MNNLQNFPIDSSVVSLWVFKSSRKRAFSVRISPKLSDELKNIEKFCLGKIEALTPYDAGAVLASDSMMQLTGPIAQWSEILNLISAPVEDRLVRSISGLQNNFAYVAVFSHEGKKLFAVKKVSSNLGAKKSSGFVDAMFSGDTLDISENLIFSIAKVFDFFVLGDEFFIARKEGFESVLGFKDYYKKSFEELLNDGDFSKRLDKLDVLKDYVKNSAVHLGRMSAIKEKRKFADDVYWKSVVSLNQSEGWGLKLDGNNKFVIEEETVRDLVSILLGHRVKSLCDREISDASGLVALRK